MPNSFRTQTEYVVTGNPDTVNESAAYYPGQPGQVFEQNQRTYQYVQNDSGTIAAAPSGVVAANQVAFWKDKTKFLVTNDLAQASGGRNAVAGIYRNAVTAGNFCFILQRGDAIPVKSDGGGAANDIAIANSGSNADVTNITAGTAPTFNPLGVIKAPASGGNISVDIDIPSVP